jgi:acyl transferase domain-containing protein
MPGAESQSQLIRDTYMRCGLDPVCDRPHYFEAHGTGTPAGDREYITYTARRLRC